MQHVIRKACNRLFRLCTSCGSLPTLCAHGRYFHKFSRDPSRDILVCYHLCVLYISGVSSHFAPVGGSTFLNFADTPHVTYCWKPLEQFIILCTYCSSPPTLRQWGAFLWFLYACWLITYAIVFNFLFQCLFQGASLFCSVIQEKKDLWFLMSIQHRLVNVRMDLPASWTVKISTVHIL